MRTKAFTLIELVVSIAVLAVVVTISGTVFQVTIETYRKASAQNEIMRKFRAITEQLDRDFSHLRKEGEIFVVWSAVPVGALVDSEDYSDDLDGDVRFDRIMFFACDDFHTYNPQPPVPDPSTGKIVRGNVARISYMLAKKPDPMSSGYTLPHKQDRHNRILARTQHILSMDENATELPDLSVYAEEIFNQWHNVNECDQITVRQWNIMQETSKKRALSVISGTDVFGIQGGGTLVDPNDPQLVHNIMAEGVGEFKIQGWTDNHGWVPLEKTHFFKNVGYSDNLSWVLYNPFYGGININNLGFTDAQVQQYAMQNRLDRIPGLGRALKFTFTLYDSKGIIEDGQTFTHIVYLDD